MFNFNSFAEVKPTNNVNYLNPYTINDNITIKKTEIKEGVGKESGKPWKSLVITFGNDEGIYNDTTFFLDINDPKTVERNTIDMANGGKREMPSRWEQTYYKLAAIGRAFAPEYIEKFNSVVGKCRTFEDFIKAYKSMLDKVIDKTTTSMKLVARTYENKSYASLPNCVGIKQATNEKDALSNGVNIGDWYTWMVNPFGSNLSFSSYEEEQKNKLANAKPTNVEVKNEIDKPTFEEIDFSSL